jgi:hypothetical protein
VLCRFFDEYAAFIENALPLIKNGSSIAIRRKRGLDHESIVSHNLHRHGGFSRYRMRDSQICPQHGRPDVSEPRALLHAGG